MELMQQMATGQTREMDWKSAVAHFQKSSSWRAGWQSINTLVPYAALWALMYWSISVSWWLTIPLAILAGGFLIRVFIIFHDCGHGSFFPSQRANNILGFLTGVLTWSPYSQWRAEHAAHHATSGDLDRRGVGDIWTLTVEEYLALPRRKRLAYRLARQPALLFLFAPLFTFFIKHRFVRAGASERERRSVFWTNVAVLAMAVGLSCVFGLKAFCIIQLVILAVAGGVGFWLFYVQHQFEGVYWERRQDWDFTTAALQGSSFYKLPKVLQWFSGNIGFHHVHHLSSRIPNYNLERCHQAHPLFSSVKAVTLLASFKSFTFRLWDEQRRELVGFGHLKTLRRTGQGAGPV
jgi:omega-6 fatty acid desaturase (delta-12 desaturase)